MKGKGLKRHELRLGLSIRYFDFSDKLRSSILWQDRILCRCRHGGNEWEPETSNIKLFCEHYLNDKATGFSLNESGKPAGDLSCQITKRVFY